MPESVLAVSNPCLSESDHSAFEIFPSAGAGEKGVVLLSHGLNNRPDSLNALTKFLNSNSFTVVRVRFRGHRTEGPDSSNFSSISADDWVEDFRSAYCISQKKFTTKKTYAISYSMGAAVTAAFLDKYRDAEFEKIIFLSPAITPNYKIIFIRLLSPLAFTGLSLPSYTPEEYRANSSLSLRAYNAYLDILRLARRAGGAFQKTPVLVLISGRDELISQFRLKEWVSEYQLSGWQFSEINPAPEDRKIINHLTFAPEYLGSNEWSKMTELINSFLNQNFNY